MWPVATWFLDVASYEAWSSCQACPDPSEAGPDRHPISPLVSASALVRSGFALGSRLRRIGAWRVMQRLRSAQDTSNGRV